MPGTLAGAVSMSEAIIGRMRRGVYYPGHHLGKREELDQLVAQGYLERMDASFFCGPDSEPAYCLTNEGCRLKRKMTRKASPHATKRKLR
jgi:hypothetical protein